MVAGVLLAAGGAALVLAQSTQPTFRSGTTPIEFTFVALDSK